VGAPSQRPGREVEAKRSARLDVKSVTLERLRQGAHRALVDVDDHRSLPASAHRSGSSIGRLPLHRTKRVLRQRGWSWVVVGRPGFRATSAGPPHLPPRCVDRPVPSVLLDVAVMWRDPHRFGGSAIS
jgi:hypothetical protein